MTEIVTITTPDGRIRTGRIVETIPNSHEPFYVVEFDAEKYGYFESELDKTDKPTAEPTGNEALEGYKILKKCFYPPDHIENWCFLRGYLMALYHHNLITLKEYGDNWPALKEPSNVASTAATRENPST